MVNPNSQPMHGEHSRSEEKNNSNIHILLLDLGCRTYVVRLTKATLM